MGSDEGDPFLYGVELKTYPFFRCGALGGYLLSTPMRMPRAAAPRAAAAAGRPTRRAPAPHGPTVSSHRSSSSVKMPFCFSVLGPAPWFPAWAVPNTAPAPVAVR